MISDELGSTALDRPLALGRRSSGSTSPGWRIFAGPRWPGIGQAARAAFVDHDRGNGQLESRGLRVDPSSIAAALLTIKGRQNGMCPLGQTCPG